MVSTQEEKEKRADSLLPSAATVCCSPLIFPGAAVSRPTIHLRLAASLSARRCEIHHIFHSVKAILRPGIHPAPARWRYSCTGHVGCGETSFSSLNPLHCRRHRRRHLLLFSGFFQLLLVLRLQHRPHQWQLTRSKAAEAPAAPSWDLSLSWRSLQL